MSWKEICARLSARLQGHGIDICCPLAASWYNNAVEPDLRMRIPSLPGYPDKDCLAVLVGNSKALWKPFLSAYCQDSQAGKELRECKDPLHLYVKNAVTSAASDAASLCSTSADVLSKEGKCFIDRDQASLSIEGDQAPSSEVAVQPWNVYWSHETEPGKLVAIQRMAAIAGLAYFDKASYLCIHPEWGPWFSLRAVLLFPVSPPRVKPEVPPCPLNTESLERVKAAMAVALSSIEDLKDMSSMREPWSITNMPESRKRWLEVRDSVHPSHPERYCEHQILYHYTRQISLLRSLFEHSKNATSTQTHTCCSG